MLELLKARRGRKAAVAFIAPLVAQSRHGTASDIPERAWFSPYMVGFMGMLISLVAERAAGSLSSDAIGNVQADAWQHLTGCRSPNIGEEICLLSTAGNRDFEAGCSRALQFLDELDRSEAQLGDHPLPPGYQGQSLDYDPQVASALWADYVDPYLNGANGFSG